MLVKTVEITILKPNKVCYYWYHVQSIPQEPLSLLYGSVENQNQRRSKASTTIYARITITVSKQTCESSCKEISKQIEEYLQRLPCHSCIVKCHNSRGNKVSKNRLHQWPSQMSMLFSFIFIFLICLSYLFSRYKML